ncbi:hypothetical protein ACOMHN_048700 [Nucella lapillus]
MISNASSDLRDSYFGRSLTIRRLFAIFVDTVKKKTKEREMLGFLYGALLVGCVSAAPATKSVDLLMPEVEPKKPDTYLCRSMDVNELKPYITGFIPNANKDIAHHMLLYGCDEPGSRKPIWNCGEMASAKTDYELGPVCASGGKIIYAWAMDAPSLTLPPDVAFKVGGNSGIKTLALQVHYKNVTTFLPPLNKKDSSGLTLVTTDVPKKRLAGVYLMLTDGMIPQGKTEYLETACAFPGDGVVIHPFAFRTHTHTLGRVVSGYRIRNGQWKEIGRQDPRKPQMFYNVTNPGITVQKGDILAARCTMENKLDHDVAIGATQNDEMCNFYVMYYVDGHKLLSITDCISRGGPDWYLKNYRDQKALNLKDMPSTASTVPGTQNPILATTPGGRQELPPGRAAAQKKREEELNEKEDPLMDELLDEYLSKLSPREMNALVSDVNVEQRYPSYLAMPVDPRELSAEEAYNRYYYPDEDDM